MVWLAEASDPDPVIIYHEYKPSQSLRLKKYLIVAVIHCNYQFNISIGQKSLDGHGIKLSVKDHSICSIYASTYSRSEAIHPNAFGDYFSLSDELQQQAGVS